METLIESYGNKTAPISYWIGNSEEENFDYNFLLGLAPQQDNVTIKGTISESNNKQTLSYGHISLGVDKEENKIYIQKDNLTEDEEKKIKFDIFEIEFSSHDEKIILYYDYTQRPDENYSLLIGKYDTNQLQIIELSDNKLELSIPENWWERENMAYTLEFPIRLCQNAIIEGQESSIVIDSIKLRIKCPNFAQGISIKLDKDLVKNTYIQYFFPSWGGGYLYLPAKVYNGLNKPIANTLLYYWLNSTWFDNIEAFTITSLDFQAYHNYTVYTIPITDLEIFVYSQKYTKSQTKFVYFQQKGETCIPYYNWNSDSDSYISKIDPLPKDTIEQNYETIMPKSDQFLLQKFYYVCTYKNEDGANSYYTTIISYS